MTDDELSAIEARFREAAPRAWAAGGMVYTVFDDDIPALIAEVRRLKARPKTVRHCGCCEHNQASAQELGEALRAAYAVDDRVIGIRRPADPDQAVLRVKRPSRS